MFCHKCAPTSSGADKVGHLVALPHTTLHFVAPLIHHQVSPVVGLYMPKHFPPQFLSWSQDVALRVPK